MRTFRTDFGAAVLLSGVLVLPFLLLEWVTQTPNPGSKLSLFGVVNLWLAPLLALYLALPIVRALRAGTAILTHPLTLALRIGVVCILAWMWGEFLLDQLPCFLGATGC